ncbi:MAG: sugar phosphate isomerase/epimerase [Candidatus Hydrogenedentes bacterium]|nr:sugar phosphate isomerase/epimerase [Candidatus Hydrogenedentota bacterium]
MTERKHDRREFLIRTTSSGLAVGVMASTKSSSAAPESAFPVLPRAIQLGMLPEKLSLEDKLGLAKACGFHGIEAYPMDDLEAAKHQGESARAAGVPIHSITYGGWDAPLSHPDPAVAEKGSHGVETALRTAKAMGADTVLLVPAVVNEQVRYVEAYERSQKRIRKLLPLAKELRIIIAVENVWNNFLLSPLEFARYVDEFHNPWLRAYFDVANVVAFAWPQDWIRTLGTRIVKVHIKDFKREGRQWTPLFEGDVNWPEVRSAFAEIGYTGFITAELPGGDEAYLREVYKRMEQIVGLK